LYRTEVQLLNNFFNVAYKVLLLYVHVAYIVLFSVEFLEGED